MRKPNIDTMYELLLSAFGPQGWWPVTRPGESCPCYCGGPVNDAQRFEVMIGAILTQNTSWKNVEKTMSVLHARRLLTTAALAAIPLEELAEAIRSSGYYNEKAKKLKSLVAFLETRPIGALRRMPLPALREALLAVRGVGPETADSILLYALNKPIFVVDAYTKRIFSRLGLVPEGVSYDHLQQLFHGNLREDIALFNEYHALLVCLGKNYCTNRTPRCGECVLRQHCRSGKLRRKESRVQAA